MLCGPIKELTPASSGVLDATSCGRDVAMVMARLAGHVKLACEAKSRFLEHRERKQSLLSEM
jgi:hypothetical protein